MKNKPLRYISLFSGIGGFELGIKKVFPKAKCVGYSEIHKPTISVYEEHFAGHKNLGDVTKLVWKHDKDGNMLADKKDRPILNKKALNKLKNFDFLVGGSPCQGLSIANITRKDLEDERSKLFYAFLAILKYCKPKHFILENVATMKKEVKEQITKLLGVEPEEINSEFFSAQKRRRLYWCSFPVSQPEDKNIFFEDILEENPDSIFDLSGKALDYMDRTVKDGRTHWNFAHHHSSLEKKSKCLVANLYKGVPYNVLLAYSRSIREIYKKDKKGKIKRNKKGKKIKIGSYDEKRIRLDGKTNTLVTSDGCGGSHSKNFIMMGARIRKLTPIECARLQTFPDNWCKNISNSQAYKAYGNAVTVEVISHIMKHHPSYKPRRKKKLLKRY